MDIQIEDAVTPAPGTTATDSAEGAMKADQAKGDANSVLNLDSVEKFVFQGAEYTPEELNKAMLRQADYTRKTQEIAEQRKFISNLEADLELVRENPKLADQFKAIYPSEFHRYLKFALKSEVESGTDSEESELPKAIIEKLKKLEMLERKVQEFDQTFREREVEAASKQLDVIMEKMSSKYPYAVEDAVLNQAQALIDMNRENPKFQMTEAVWERLFKQVNDKTKTKFESQYRNQLEAQMKKSEKAGDTAPGGLAPGRGPSGPRTIAEATEMAIQDFRARGAR